MRYISTRDVKKTEYTFSEILLKGLAEDGGLYMPAELPSFSLSACERLSTLPYHELAFEILQHFVGDSIPEKELKELLTNTYKKELFGSEDIAPVEHIESNIYLQDLSSGPSLAFKDMAMQFLGNIMEYELNRQNKTLTILGASSGDTVSAAEEAMKGKERINVVMLTPKEGMSSFQKAQAGSILEENIFNVSIQGPFDHCQDLIKEINRDVNFKQTHHIGAVNSINWGRICAQIVYYFKGYFGVVDTVGEPVDMVVPSGNFGNILAAYFAKKMGLPIRRLIAATNENIVLDAFFKTGIYKQREVIVTSSPSMDISKASNIERLFFDLCNKDAKKLNKIMKTFEKTKEIDLSEYSTSLSQLGFCSGNSTHQERIDIIKKVYDRSKRVIDPHTASGIKVAQELNDQRVPLLCMETAKPAKFEDAIKEALGFVPARPAIFKDLEKKPTRFYDCLGTAEAVKTFITDHITIKSPA